MPGEPGVKVTCLPSCDVCICLAYPARAHQFLVGYNPSSFRTEWEGMGQGWTLDLIFPLLPRVTEVSTDFRGCLARRDNG